MPIPFTCPSCGRQTTVADEYAGQSGPCAGCGRTVTVPGAGGAATPYAPPSSSGTKTLVIVLAAVAGVLVVCSGILLALLLPAVQAAREAARRSQCTNNLKQIALALRNYHDIYKTFPPAYIADDDGKPMHSWRVLILPFLEQSPLYDSYDFSQPWDSPANQMVAQADLPVYRCPSQAAGNAGQTNYMMVVGPGRFSEGPNGHTFGEILDGTSNTIMVGEVVNSGVGWSQPVDVTNLAEIDSEHPGVVNVAMADGSVRAVPKPIDPQQLEPMTSVAGRESVDMDW